MATGLTLQFARFAADLARWRDNAADRTLVPRDVDGVYLVEPDGRRLVNFGGNDYLGLAAQTIKSYETVCGSGASPLVCGFSSVHKTLAQRLAQWEETEAAVLFPCGYSACVGTIAALAGEDDLLLSDQLNHASLIDGCRLSKANRYIYPHNNLAEVRALLAQHRGTCDQAWIVTDGVFSMDGEAARLTALCDLADEFDAVVIVDEAHGTGVLGDDGSGTCAEAGVKDRVLIRIGTLSKALGSLGGFVVGPQVVIDYLINRCRSLIYSTASPPLQIQTAIDAIDTLHAEPQRRLRVRSLAKHLREQLIQLGFIDGEQAGNEIPIIPIVLGSNQRIMRAAERLQNEGFFVPAIRPPTVLAGQSRLRVTLSAAHREDQVAALVNALQRACHE